MTFAGEQGEIRVGYRHGRRSGLHVEVGGRPLDPVTLVSCDPHRVGLEVGGHLRWFRVHRRDGVHHVDGPAGSSTLVELPRFPAAGIDEEPGSLHAPMPGRVVRVHVSEGDEVADGQLLVVMEAMKMEHTLRAPFAGVVTGVRATEGDQVEADAVLVIVEEAPAVAG